MIPVRMAALRAAAKGASAAIKRADLKRGESNGYRHLLADVAAWPRGLKGLWKKKLPESIGQPAGHVGLHPHLSDNNKQQTLNPNLSTLNASAQQGRQTGCMQIFVKYISSRFR